VVVVLLLHLLLIQVVELADFLTLPQTLRGLFLTLLAGLVEQRQALRLRLELLRLPNIRKLVQVAAEASTAQAKLVAPAVQAAGPAVPPASDNGFASGTGGAGANGFAVIITYF
jgi:hypothetical protein